MGRAQRDTNEADRELVHRRPTKPEMIPGLVFGIARNGYTRLDYLDG